MSDLKAKFEVMPASGPVKHPCSKCRRDTNHMMVTGYRESGFEDCGDGNGYSWTSEHMLMQCQGCDTVSFYRASTNSEDWDPIDGYYVDASYFPPLAKHAPRFESHELPLGLMHIYEETIKAIDGGQPILAAIGIRAIVEAICNEQGVKGGDLKEQITKLQSKALVTAEGARCLQTLREVGNDAAHRVHRHKTAQLVAAIKVVEHLIEGTYMLPEAVDEAFKPKAKEVATPVPQALPAVRAEAISRPIPRAIAPPESDSTES